MNCRNDRQYNEKKKSTLSNERRQASCVDYRNGQLLSNKSDGLLDMGGVMTEKITEQEFCYWVDYEQLKPEWLVDVMLSIINEEGNQQSMSDLRSEIKQAFKDSKEASDE